VGGRRRLVGSVEDWKRGGGVGMYAKGHERDQGRRYRGKGRKDELIKVG